MNPNDPACAGHAKPNGRAPGFRRREFLGLAGAAMLAPGAGRAQEASPVIGFVYSGAASRAGPLVAAFWQGLNQAGFAEHRNVTAVYAFADGHDARLPELVRTLLPRGVSLIVAGGAAAAAAARQSGEKTPIVFVAAAAPAGGGFDLDHAAANLTGVSIAAPDLLAARLRNLLTLAPAVRSAAVLINPQTPNIEVQLGYVGDEAKERGVAVRVVRASGEADFAAALGDIARARPDALVVANDGFLNSNRARLIGFAAQNRMPAAFANRDFVEAGGLLSYGPSLTAAYRQAGDYAAQILKGRPPADLAIAHPLEIELALNAKTAASLGLAIPPALAAAASEIVQ